MSLLRKLFGFGSSQWDELVADCDLEMARDEIADMFRIESAEARKRGGEYEWKEDCVLAWERFRDTPTKVNACKLLDVAPPMRHFFELCRPGSPLYMARSFQKERKGE